MTTTPAFTEADFRKSSASHPDKECVRVARRAGRVEIRDDKTAFGSPADHRLVLTETEFDTFLAATRAGQTTGLPLHITHNPDGTHTLRPMRIGAQSKRLALDPQLHFTAAEVTAFLAGVHAHEFDAPAYAA